MTDADGGLYVLLIRLPRYRRIRVGRLGAFDFPRGWYLYVGSAQRNRAARLARHGRKAKRLHWHVDYLLVGGRLMETVCVPGTAEMECRLADHLERALGLRRWPRRFGASDCRCSGHLRGAARRPAVEAALDGWTRQGAAGGRLRGSSR